MNVKPGDLVRYVGVNTHNRPNVYGWVGITIKYMLDSEGAACWQVDPPLPGGSIRVPRGIKHGFLVKELNLRPIFDTPGEDETLQWLDVPSERVTA